MDFFFFFVLAIKFFGHILFLFQSTLYHKVDKVILTPKIKKKNLNFHGSDSPILDVIIQGVSVSLNPKLFTPVTVYL